MKNLLLSVAVSAALAPAYARIEPGTPFADRCVLQRGMKLPVWGTATAGAAVTVTFARQTVTTTAGTNGAWRVTLAPLEASKTPRELVVTEVPGHPLGAFETK